MNNNLIELIAILDKSGSMNHVASESVQSFNQLIEAQNNNDKDIKITLTLFNESIQKIADAIDMKHMPPLLDSDYRCHGWTALYDAIGTTIKSVGERLNNTLEEDRPSKVIVIILTDGLDNVSSKYNLQSINEMIITQKEVYNWEFLYLGANQDAWSVGQTLGIGNTVTFDTTVDTDGCSWGTQSAYYTASLVVKDLISKNTVTDAQAIYNNTMKNK